MAPGSEDIQKADESESSEGDYTYDYMMNRVDPYQENYDFSVVECFQYWSVRFLINGMFTTSRILGYTQLMIYTILRVIITGSLCGRFFGNDPDRTICAWNETDNMTAINTSSCYQPIIPSLKNYDLTSYAAPNVSMTCLNKAYRHISPITMWALGLLPVFLSWILLLPWTPFRYDQEYVVCKPGHSRWPCLTIYIVRFIRSFVRFILELTCLILVPVIYGMKIPNTVSCYQNRVTCVICNADEKTFFLWLLATVNMISCGLSFGELFDICRNKQQYEVETGFSSSISKISSARSSNSYLMGGTNDRVQRYYEKKSQKGKGAQTTRLQTLGSTTTEKRRIGTTRAATDDAETQVNSKFRGRAPKPDESDDVIKLASMKESENDVATKTPLPSTSGRDSAPIDRGEGPSTSSSGNLFRNGEASSNPTISGQDDTEITIIQEPEHEPGVTWKTEVTAK